MADNKEIRELKEEIKRLEQQIKENQEGDVHRGKEIKALQEEQNKDNARWNKINAVGVFSTPLTLIFGLVTWWLNKHSTDVPVIIKRDNLGKGTEQEIKEIKSEVKSIKDLLTKRIETNKW